jgi:hypothetical protein
LAAVTSSRWPKRPTWSKAIPYGVAGRSASRRTCPVASMPITPVLRQVAKRWVAEDLPRRRGANAPNVWQYCLASLTELATSLRLQRDDHGSTPALLGRADIVAFTNRLAFLHQCGQLSANRRIDILRHIRTVITAARLLGLTRPGQAAARSLTGIRCGWRHARRGA